MTENADQDRAAWFWSAKHDSTALFGFEPDISDTDEAKASFLFRKHGLGEQLSDDEIPKCMFVRPDASNPKNLPHAFMAGGLFVVSSTLAEVFTDVRSWRRSAPAH